MYKLSTSTPSTALVATPLSMDGHYTTLQPSRYHAFPCVFVLALPGAPKFFHSRRVEKHKLSIHCYSHNKGTLCWPHVHHVILLEPSMPGAKTDSGICCFHAFNLISIQSNPKHSCSHAPNAQTIQLPQNLPFTVSFHVSSFLSCHEPPKRPKDPFNRFSTSWGTPGSGNTTVAYMHCDSHNKGTFCWPQRLQVVRLEPSLPGDETPFGSCCFHEFNIISIQRIHETMLQ